VAPVMIKRVQRMDGQFCDKTSTRSIAGDHARPSLILLNVEVAADDQTGFVVPKMRAALRSTEPNGRCDRASDPSCPTENGNCRSQRVLSQKID